jgi:hypothetical protein
MAIANADAVESRAPDQPSLEPSIHERHNLCPVHTTCLLQFDPLTHPLLDDIALVFRCSVFID